ncbi:hypothetical protein MNO14_01860 [Luteimonas sp. S4-F44]|uniref:hypothetical protein n=1 Tax=Luteimonas sp. S4-F44 TaxID=2925842 RepID=UPI001F53C3EC|nr:hypothetical protein [Luteimonas sp. S4-F44]UNK44218.1 hypothetical protein MNO14_01860 [Luteimonas sp. S4-F44]
MYAQGYPSANTLPAGLANPYDQAVQFPLGMPTTGMPPELALYAQPQSYGGMPPGQIDYTQLRNPVTSDRTMTMYTMVPPNESTARPPGDTRSAAEIREDNPVLANLGNQSKVRDNLNELVGGDMHNDPDQAFRAAAILTHIKSLGQADGTARSEEVMGNGKIEGFTKDGHARHGTEAGMLQDVNKYGLGHLERANGTLDSTNDKHVKADGTNRDNWDVIRDDYLRPMFTLGGAAASLIPHPAAQAFAGGLNITNTMLDPNLFSSPANAMNGIATGVLPNLTPLAAPFRTPAAGNTPTPSQGAPNAQPVPTPTPTPPGSPSPTPVASPLPSPFVSPPSTPMPTTLTTPPSTPMPTALTTPPSTPMPTALTTPPSTPMPTALTTPPSTPMPTALTTPPSTPMPTTLTTPPSTPVPTPPSTPAPLLSHGPSLPTSTSPDIVAPVPVRPQSAPDFLRYY